MYMIVEFQKQTVCVNQIHGTYIDGREWREKRGLIFWGVWCGLSNNLKQERHFFSEEEDDY